MYASIESTSSTPATGAAAFLRSTDERQEGGTFEIESADVDLVDDTATFYAPVSSDAIDALLGQYAQARRNIEQLGAIIAGDLGNAVHYFIEGNAGDDRFHRSVYLEKLFVVDGALAALNAAYWSKTLALTDVLDCMPQLRRDEWNQSIREQKTPEYNEESVRPTISGLLAMRHQFFAERVDGIFRALSHAHVTNVPEGFNKRMILSHVVTDYGSPDSSRSGYINDLRAVIAKFMGRDEPKWNATSSVVAAARRRHGEWLTLDGGAMRIRVYLKGTAHLEVHPDMAYRLNQILAHLHPFAIPAEFRTKPKKRAKEFVMMTRPLPFAVLAMLSSLRVVRERIGGVNDWNRNYVDVPNARTFDVSSSDKVVEREAERVLEAIGGTRAGKHLTHFQFDYNPDRVIEEIIASGCLPDRQAHQFYGTPPRLAAIAVELARIGDADTVLEPEAGQGGLAEFLPKDRTVCVEISAIHCAVLTAKGFNAIQADFLEWAKTASRFSRLVMNPPFSQDRASLHLEAAASLVEAGGRLTAILPASMRGKDVLPGWAVEWSSVYANEFPGTSAAVVILTADRPR